MNTVFFKNSETITICSICKTPQEYISNPYYYHECKTCNKEIGQNGLTEKLNMGFIEELETKKNDLLKRFNKIYM